MQLAVLGDKLCFSAIKGNVGRELWTFGGSGQPAMAPELNPGSGDGMPPLSETPPAVMNGRLYFAGTNAGGAGLEPYYYDGTGTPGIVVDLNPGTSGSSPNGFFVFGDKLFFAADNGSAGFELYTCVHNGLPVLHDLLPGNSSSNPGAFTAFNGKVYFSAELPGVGQELCVYDPATDAVTLVADIAPGIAGSGIYRMAVLDNVLYFSARTADGYELWRFDGTSASMVRDLAPGSGSGMATEGWLAAYNGGLYFSGTTDLSEYRLWRYDPVADVLLAVATPNPGGAMRFGYPLVFDNKLYFRAASSTEGAELWMHDGSTTAMVADLNAGAAGSDPAYLCSFGGALYFSAATATTGTELFRLGGPNSIANLAFAGRAAVAPNPTRSEATLLLSLTQAQSCSIVLTDLSGALLWQQPEGRYERGDHRIALPVGALPAGLYCYAVRSGGRLLATGRLQKL